MNIYLGMQMYHSHYVEMMQIQMLCSFSLQMTPLRESQETEKCFLVYP